MQEVAMITQIFGGCGDNNNCQTFSSDMVRKNGLAPYDEEASFLEPQDSYTLLNSIPKPLAWVPNTITDLAASADRATSMVADGLKKRKRKTKN